MNQRAATANLEPNATATIPQVRGSRGRKSERMNEEKKEKMNTWQLCSRKQIDVRTNETNCNMNEWNSENII